MFICQTVQWSAVCHSDCGWLYYLCSCHMMVKVLEGSCLMAGSYITNAMNDVTNHYAHFIPSCVSSRGSKISAVCVCVCVGVYVCRCVCVHESYGPKIWHEHCNSMTSWQRLDAQAFSLLNGKGFVKVCHIGRYNINENAKICEYFIDIIKGYKSWYDSSVILMVTSVPGWLFAW